MTPPLIHRLPLPTRGNFAPVVEVRIVQPAPTVGIVVAAVKVGNVPPAL